MLLAFLDQCGSLNSLGRFTWSQASSVHVQSLWRDATLHIGKQTGLLVQRLPGLSEVGVAGGWGPTDDRGRPFTPFRPLCSAGPPSQDLLRCLLWMPVPAQNATVFGAAVTTPWIQKQTEAKCRVLMVWDSPWGEGESTSLWVEAWRLDWDCLQPVAEQK